MFSINFSTHQRTQERKRTTKCHLDALKETSRRKALVTFSSLMEEEEEEFCQEEDCPRL